MKKDKSQRQENRADIETFKKSFEMLMDSMPDIFYALCCEGKFVFVNHAVRNLGYDPDELIGRHFSEVMTPSSAESCGRVEVLKKLNGKKTGTEKAPKLFDERRTGERKTSGLEVHLLIKGKDGAKTSLPDALAEDTVLTEVTSSGCYDFSATNEEPIFIGSIGIMKDITEKKKTEAKICCLEEELAKEAAEARYFNILEVSPDAIISSNEDGSITQWNEGAEKLFGYCKNDALGKKVTILIPEEHRENHEKGFRKISNSNKNQFVRKISEMEALRKDGRRAAIEMTLSAIRLKESLHFTAIIRDISDRKKAELDLLKSEDKYRRLISSVSAYVYSSYLENGEIIRTDHGSGCEKITGYSSDDFKNDDLLWYKVIYEEDRYMVVKHAEKIASGETVTPIEHRIIHKDGSIKWIRNSTIQNFDGKGELVSYDGLIEDISRHKETEEKTKNNLDTVERLNTLMAGREKRIAALRKENEYLLSRIVELEK